MASVKKSHRDKIYVPNSWYHVWNRGHSKLPVFRHACDYSEFLEIFRRHLDVRPSCDPRRRPYRNLHGEIAVAAYCLMPNHFHLVIRQAEAADAIARLMRYTMIGYGRYFNRRYQRLGALFQNRYCADRIGDVRHLTHACSYVHLNHGDDPEYEYCSHRYFVDPVSAPSWLRPGLALEVIGGFDRYEKFISALAAERREQAEIKARQLTLDALAGDLIARERNRLRPSAPTHRI